MARVRAVLRRISPGAGGQKQVFVFDTLCVNLDDYTVTIDKVPVSLTKKEIEILWTLAVNGNKVFSRDNLFDTIWGQGYYGDRRTVDGHIQRLRAKLDKYEHKAWEIKTIWGVGYKFEAAADVEK
jgi:DNA-binding response OmpR family regulator